VKGRKTEFMIYELLALRGSDDPALRVRDGEEQLSAMTLKASGSFEAGDLVTAKRAFTDILEKFPSDLAARFMLNEIAEMRRTKAKMSQESPK
jgi:Tfp pilus assembly protein PilF